MGKTNEPKLFNIQAAAEISGLSAHTIRAWEKRYQAIIPSRNETGKRMYNEQELERLKVLALLVNFGSTISQIANLTDLELTLMLEKLTQSKSKWSAPAAMEKDQVEKLVGPILDDLVRYDIDAITQKLINARDASSARDLVFHLLVPLLMELKTAGSGRKLNQGHSFALKSLIRLHAAWALVPKKGKTDAEKIFIASLEEIDATESILVSLLCLNYHHDFFCSHIPLPISAMIETAQSLKSRILVFHLARPLTEAMFQDIMRLTPPQMSIWIRSDQKSSSEQRKIHFYRDYAELEELLLDA